MRKFFDNAMNNDMVAIFLTYVATALAMFTLEHSESSMQNINSMIVNFLTWCGTDSSYVFYPLAFNSIIAGFIMLYALHKGYTTRTNALDSWQGKYMYVSYFLLIPVLYFMFF